MASGSDVPVLPAEAWEPLPGSLFPFLPRSQEVQVPERDATSSLSLRTKTPQEGPLLLSHDGHDGKQNVNLGGINS